MRFKMNYKSTVCIAVLFTIFTLFNVSANEKQQAVILIEAEVYKHLTAKKQSEIDELLTGAILETAPVLIMNVGGTAAIEISLQNEEGNEDDMLRLHFQSDKNGVDYTVDFQLNNKGAERISSVETTVDSTLVLSSSLYGTLKIAKIKTRKFASLALALKAKDSQ